MNEYDWTNERANACDLTRGPWSEAEIIAASAKHPFDHIQYGVSSLLSGQSSATGDPRAGAYYFPAWEIPDAMGRHSNKVGKHYLYEFGLKVG